MTDRAATARRLVLRLERMRENVLRNTTNLEEELRYLGTMNFASVDAADSALSQVARSIQNHKERSAELDEEIELVLALGKS